MKRAPRIGRAFALRGKMSYNGSIKALEGQAADMGEWLGALGGLGMVALIAALLVRFLRDMGASIPAEAPKTMGAAAAVMVVERMIAGLCHYMHVAPVSVLNIPAVWRRVALTGSWPFNWYVSLLTGAWIAWSVRRLTDARWTALFLAVPGAVLLFLPTWWAWIGFAAMLALRLALRGRAGKAPRLPQPLYLSLLGVLSLLSGLFILLFTGGGAA